MIRTVRGDIEPGQLGWCQCHEHLFLEKGKSCEINGALCMDDFESSMAELNAYAKAGGNAYVDAQPVGCGRMAEAMVKASDASGVHIIGSTGFHKTCFYEDDSFIFSANEFYLTELFISEIKEGMLSSRKDGEKRLDAKAGIIKVAVDKGGIYANKTYEKLFNAAVVAARETGAAVLAHFEPDTDAFELLKLLEKSGISARRLIACHLDRARYDAGYHQELAASGIYLEYDTINRLNYHDNNKEIKLISEMIAAGYTDHLLLSLDTTNKRLRSYGADMGLDYILADFSAQLENAGIGKEILQQIMIRNAANAIGI